MNINYMNVREGNHKRNYSYLGNYRINYASVELIPLDRRLPGRRL